MSLAKYPDHRYFSLSVFLIILSLFREYIYESKEIIKNSIAISKISLLVGFVSVFGIFSYFYSDIIVNSDEKIMQNIVADFSPFLKKDALIGCRGYQDSFAYYSENKYIIFPVNVVSFSDENLMAWKKHFGVSFLIIKNDEYNMDGWKTEVFDSSSLTPIAKSNGYLLFDISGLK